MILLALLAQAAEPAGPIASLRGHVVEAIRNCPKATGDEIAVCARDRGFSERYRIERLDPRFAAKPPVSVDVLAGAGAQNGACAKVGAAAGVGCALRDYNDWGDWKDGAKADGRWFPW